MNQNFFEQLGQWISGAKTPEIQTTIGFENASLYKTGGILAAISLLFLGGLKIVLNTSLDRYAERMGR